ncbi:MAG: aspartate kinase, partial [Planctomycetaceae bacterium]|nr:aspartate kinase [Planctomycetaceae bacterium]
RIKTISNERIRKALDAGQIVIAAGFQGIDDENNITTLGRGGSDTSAVALAAALGADQCDIYTDVDGVYTTDPRLVSEARKVSQISYDEMLELASLGAGVMHSRSIEFAKKFGVAVQVRSSFTDTAGSLIISEPESNAPVAGCALAKNESRVTLIGVPDKPGNAMRLFSKIAEAKIATDMIVQNISVDGKTDISFTVSMPDLTATLDVLKSAMNDIGAERIDHAENVAKVSAVGLGMVNQSGVAHKMFRAISNKGINISMISTSEMKISVLVSLDEAPEALRAVHSAFELEKAPELPQTASSTAVKTADASAANVDMSRLSGMEDILIENINLDKTQARITVPELPDKPGIAAEMFEKIAAAGVLVDMIVQSCGRNCQAMITFTVPRELLKKTLQVIEKLTKEWGSASVLLINPKTAILSVCGTGLRSHTGIAYRMFKTLADGGINVNVISTSERRVEITVNEENGETGLELLKKEFAGDMI